jgi:hypothetical protein
VKNAPGPAAVSLRWQPVHPVFTKTLASHQRFSRKHQDRRNGHRRCVKNAMHKEPPGTRRQILRIRFSRRHGGRSAAAQRCVKNAPGPAAVSLRWQPVHPVFTKALASHQRFSRKHQDRRNGHRRCVKNAMHKEPPGTRRQILRIRFSRRHGGRSAAAQRCVKNAPGPAAVSLRWQLAFASPSGHCQLLSVGTPPAHDAR